MINIYMVDKIIKQGVMIMTETFLCDFKNKILNEDFYCLSDKEIKSNNRRIEIPLIILANYHLYFIFNLKDNVFNNEKEKIRFTNDFLTIRQRFNISENMTSVFCINETEEHLELYKFNHINNSFLRTPDIFKHIIEDKDMYRENKRIYEVYNSLCFAELKKRYVYDIYGDIYVRKNDRWLKCSKEDTDSAFDQIVYNGVFGKHKHKKRTALLYTITGGMCGMAVLIDLLCLFYGIAKDNDGFYYAPLSYSNKEVFFKIFIAMIICFAIVGLYCFVLMTISGLAESMITDLIINKI